MTALLCSWTTPGACWPSWRLPCCTAYAESWRGPPQWRPERIIFDIRNGSSRTAGHGAATASGAGSAAMTEKKRRYESRAFDGRIIHSAEIWSERASSSRAAAQPKSAWPDRLSP
jgi:hypothetical protein